MRRDLLFVAAWAALPVVLKLVLLSRRGPRRSRGALALAGAIQEVGVSLGVLAVLRGLAALHPPSSALGAGAALLFWLVQTDVLVDHLLFSRLGTRLSPALADVGDPRSLLSSAWEIGLGWAILGSVVLLACGLALASSLAIEPEGVAVVLAQGAASVLCVALGAWVLPPSARYWAAPAVVLQLGSLLRAHERAELDDDVEAPAGAARVDREMAVDFASRGRPHVLLVLLESFRGVDVGALGGARGVTPDFDAWARRGLLFTDFYANGVQSVGALVASLDGVLPRLAIAPPRARARGPALRGLPEALAAAGYHAAYWHGGDLAFQNVGSLLRESGFREIVGEAELRAAGVDGRASSTWGVDDEHLFAFAADRLQALDAAGDPCFGVIFTITNHHPWRTPEGHAAPSFEGASSTHRAFLRSMHYADACLGRFLRDLERRGLLERSIVVLVGDHGQPMGERDGSYQLWSGLHDEALRVPLLVLAPGRVAPARVEGIVGSQVDIAPTVLDLLGERDLATGAHGRSLVRRAVDRAAFFGNPFGGGWIGMRRGPYKVILGPGDERPRLFRLDRDPGELEDIAVEEPERARAMSAECRATFRRLSRSYRAREAGLDAAPAPRSRSSASPGEARACPTYRASAKPPAR